MTAPRTARLPKTLRTAAGIAALVFVFGWAAPVPATADDASVAGVVEIAETPTQAPPAATVQPLVELAAKAGVDDVNDPLEPVNRFFFEFNELLQDALLRPIASFYNQTFPATFREGVSNFLDNLATPVILANDLLQGELDRALQTIGRAVVNTTFGMAGIADVAGELGVERHKEDFGQTLAVYGMDEGFYLVLPIFGPSNPRDAVGKLLVDPYFDPLGLWLDNTDQDDVAWTLTGVRGIDEYASIAEELNQIKKTSVDYYAAVRSLYRQKRKTEIQNGSTLELPPIPDLGYDIQPEDFDQPLAGVNVPLPRY